LLETALHLCNAGTAGFSLLRLDPAGETTIQWAAVTGELASHEGTQTPRDFSPCGMCIDAGAPVLLSHPERVFTYLRDARPSIVEDLIVPLYDSAREALGTFWIAHHDPASVFCADDARIAELLATQLVLALKLLEQADEHRYTLTLVRSHQTAERNSLAHDLAAERMRRERAEASAEVARQALEYKDAVIRDSHHRVKNTLQIAASLLSVHARATPVPEVRAALLESHERLHVLARVHEMLCTSADGAQIIAMPALLHATGAGLRRSFDEMSCRVELLIKAEQIALSAEDAIPLALLANEIVTNAYKHAFPDGSSGEIAISLRRGPRGAIVLQITDNGVGMRSTGGAGGSGLRLARTFAAQLQGALEFAKGAEGAGTHITLTIRRGGRARELADDSHASISLSAGVVH
jgi:two-component sensor histidine kinase